KADCLCVPTTMPPPVPPAGRGMTQVNFGLGLSAGADLGAWHSWGGGGGGVRRPRAGAGGGGGVAGRGGGAPGGGGGRGGGGREAGGGRGDVAAGGPAERGQFPVGQELAQEWQGVDFFVGEVAGQLGAQPDQQRVQPPRAGGHGEGVVGGGVQG